MNKKITILMTIMLIFTIIPLSQNAKSDGIFTDKLLESQTDITWQDTSETQAIMPNGEIREIDIEISYSITAGFLGGLYLNLLKNKKITMNIEIIEKPEWSTALINTNELTFDINSENQTQKLKLSVQVNKNATAFKPGIIKIKTSTNELKGFLNLSTLISKNEKTVEIPITPDYIPLIEVESKSNYYRISPFNSSSIPINITNMGNDKTKILIYLEETPENWNISIPSSITLEQNEKKQILLTTMADNSFQTKEIKIRFTPINAKNSTLQGPSTIQTYVLENDGSYKEEKEETDTGMILTIITVIIIIFIIIALIVILQKRKNQYQ